jgi:hypothetical protein
MMPGAQGNGSRRRDGEAGSGPAFDPDNPWATEEGVDPVIEAPRFLHRHDPGPGVIGWQR